MELRHLRYFKSLAEHLNFTRAAERLYITQSTLSHQIKQLEDEVGVPLFDRGGKKIALTHAGQHLLESVNRATEDLDAALRQIKALQEPLSGRLAIGATHTFSINFLGHYLGLFMKQFPLVRLEILELPAQEIEDRLMDETLDIGIAYTPCASDALWSEPLFTESLVLVTNKQHPLASRKRLRMVELHNQPLVLLSRTFATRRLLDDFFDQAKIKPLVLVETNTVTPIISLIKSQPVAAILSEKAIPAEAGLHTILLQDPAPTRTAALLWKKNKHYSKTALALAKLVKGGQ